MAWWVQLSVYIQTRKCWAIFSWLTINFFIQRKLNAQTSNKACCLWWFIVATRDVAASNICITLWDNYAIILECVLSNISISGATRREPLSFRTTGGIISRSRPRSLTSRGPRSSRRWPRTAGVGPATNRPASQCMPGERGTPHCSQW